MSLSKITERGLTGLRQGVQVMLGVQCRHTAGSGGCDRLPIDMVADVTGGKYAGDTAGGRIALDATFHLEVAAFVHLQLAFEKFCIGLVTNGNKDTVCL